MKKNKLICLFGSFIALTAACFTNLSADDTTYYHSQNDKSGEQASGYTKTSTSSARYLAYRDIPDFIDKYVKGQKTLDYGAGTGISTSFLLSRNLDVTGVDISSEMLSQAVLNYPETSFYLINDGHVPLEAGSCDFVFSSLVLFEIGTEQGIIQYLEEAKRVMKDDGVLIALTGSQDLYSKDWYSFIVDYPENKNLKSGDLAKCYLCDAQIEFIDFYWTEEDYCRCFTEAGFELIEIHYPLGKENEPYSWKDEMTTSPFVIFVAKKLTDR